MARVIQLGGNVNQVPALTGIALGVSLPFEGPAGGFTQTFTTADQVKANLVNYLLTNNQERVFNNNFGANLKALLFENTTNVSFNGITDIISNDISANFPEINLMDVDLKFLNDQNQVTLTIEYQIIPSTRIENINLQINGTN